MERRQRTLAELEAWAARQRAAEARRGNSQQARMAPMRELGNRLQRRLEEVEEAAEARRDGHLSSAEETAAARAVTAEEEEEKVASRRRRSSVGASGAGYVDADADAEVHKEAPVRRWPPTRSRNLPEPTPRSAKYDSDALSAVLESVASGAMLSNMSEIMPTRRCKQGEVVVPQGVVGDTFYVVKLGSVELVSEQAGVVTKLGTLVGGHYFGERSLLTSEPTAASVVVLEDGTELLCLDKARFETLLSPLLSREATGITPRVTVTS